MAKSKKQKTPPRFWRSKYATILLSVFIFLSLDGFLIYWIALHPPAFRRQELDFGVFGLNAYKRRDYADAADNFQKATQQKPTSEAVWYNLGNSYFKLGKYWEAALAYQRAVSLEPSDSDAKFNLALTQKRALESLQSGETVTGDIFPLHKTPSNPKAK